MARISKLNPVEEAALNLKICGFQDFAEFIAYYQVRSAKQSIAELKSNCCAKYHRKEIDFWEKELEECQKREDFYWKRNPEGHEAGIRRYEEMLRECRIRNGLSPDGGLPAPYESDGHETQWYDSLFQGLAAMSAAIIIFMLMAWVNAQMTQLYG